MLSLGLNELEWIYLLSSSYYPEQQGEEIRGNLFIIIKNDNSIKESVIDVGEVLDAPHQQSNNQALQNSEQRDLSV